LKICTVNVPESYIDAINKLIVRGKGLYPSRSELIRVAVREFLLRELKMVKNLPKYNKIEEEYDKTKFVRVPIIDSSNKNTHEFKTYKIVRRLEF